MALSEVVAGLSEALAEARAEFYRIETKISELQAERNRVAALSPHTDDIIAFFMRGLDTAGKNFDQVLGAHLAGMFTGEDGAQAASGTAGANLLLVEADADKQARRDQSLRAQRGIRPDINASLLAYLLRDTIAAEVPALVERLFPASRSGLKAAERKVLLADLDAELERLTAERADLSKDIGAVRQAANAG